MTVRDRRGLQPVWGEGAPAWIWGGLLAAGSLAMALAVRFWLMAAAPVSAQAAVIPAEVDRPGHAGPLRPAPVPDRPLRDSSSGGADGSGAEDCPPLFPVRFASGSDTPVLDPAGLDGLAGWLLSHRHTVLVIDGHADAMGPDDANFALSRRRAAAVAARFAAAGLPESRMMLRAFGKYAPLAGIPEASARNRRADLSVSGTTPCPDREAQ